jgi:outer membrane protein, multidrug efflux system
VKYSSRAFLLILPILLAPIACRTPGEGDSAALDLAVPPAWSSDPSDAPPLEDAWWRAFDDEGLALLVEEALLHNRDLAASAARLEGAAAQARLAGADLMPQVSASGSAGRSQQVFVGLPIPGGTDVLQSRSTSCGVSLNVTWEIDLWGRMRAGRDAALEDLTASAADHRGAQLSIAAQTTKGWLAWQETRLQEAVIENTVESFERTSRLIEGRYEAGRGSSLDVHRSRGDLADARARLEQRREASERARRQLEILLGRFPSGELSGAASLPSLPPLPPAGVPSELLLRRPDLIAAAARLRATDERAYEARAQRFPRLSLSGSAGRTAGVAEDLVHPEFDVWSLLAGLTQPIFQGGRIEAGIEIADARTREAAAGYAASALRAFAEVDTSLAVEDTLARREEQQELAARSATTARDIAEDRYETGLADLTTLLDAQRRALQIESELLSLRFLRLEARVDLFLALGGGLLAETSLPEETSR